MHIPDGFLGPKTCAAAYGVFIPAAVLAWRSVSRKLGAATSSHLALAAAFVFVLMMFNVPVPGGTTGHAVGTALLAIVLGPAAAIIAQSFALLLQAVVFADGGITTYGANAFNMGVVQACTAFAVWRAFGASFDRPASWRFRIGAFSAAWCAVVAGAAATAFQLGLQPALYHNGSGVPMYFPFGLKVTLAAMMASHSLVGILEGAITLAAASALARIPDFQFGQAAPAVRKRMMPVLAAMVLFVPIGIFLPQWMGADGAWGEWSPDEAAEVASLPAAPAGMEKLADIYRHAPAPDYQFMSSGGAEGFQYTGAALLGVFCTLVVFGTLQRFQMRWS